MIAVLRAGSLIALAALVASGPGCRSSARPASLEPDRVETTVTAPESLLPAVRRVELENGLTVVIREDHRQPVVALAVSHPGDTHLFRHVMFERTGRFSAEEVRRVVFTSGGFRKTVSLPGRTIFLSGFPAENLDDFLRLEAARMGPLDLMSVARTRETRRISREERESGKGAWEKLEAEMRLHLSDDPLEDRRARRATIVIVGDVTEADCLSRIRELFGSIPSGKSPPERRPSGEAVSGIDRAVFSTDEGGHRMLFACRSKGAAGLSMPLRELLGSVLVERVSKRIESDDLSPKGGVAVGACEPALFSFRLVVRSRADRDVAEELLLREIDRVTQEPLSGAELERVRTRIRARFVRRNESVVGRAISLARYAPEGNLAGRASFLRDLANLTPRQFLAGARLMFLGARTFTGWAKGLPEAECPLEWTGEAMDTETPLALPRLAPFTEKRLPNGATLLVKRVAGAPLVSFRVYVPGGEVTDLAAPIAKLLATGFRNEEDGREWDEGRIRSWLEERAAILRADGNGIALQVLSEHREDAVQFLSCLARFPTFPREAVAREREKALQRFVEREQNPEAVAMALLNRSLYPGHPRARRTTAPEGLRREEVVSGHRKLWRPGRAVIVAVGDLDPVGMVAVLARGFEGWEGGPPSELSGAPEYPNAGSPDQFTFRRSDRVELLLGARTDRRWGPDFVALCILESILCSRRGRFFRAVPDLARGYLAWRADEQPGAFLLHLRTRADRMEETLEGVLRELVTFLQTGLTEEEREEGKSHARNRSWWRGGDSSSIAEALVEMKRYDLSSDQGEKFVRGVDEMTGEGLERVARKYLSVDRLTKVVVGPVDRRGRVIPLHGK